MATRSTTKRELIDTGRNKGFAKRTAKGGRYSAVVVLKVYSALPRLGDSATAMRRSNFFTVRSGPPRAVVFGITGAAAGIAGAVAAVDREAASDTVSMVAVGATDMAEVAEAGVTAEPAVAAVLGAGAPAEVSVVSTADVGLDGATPAAAAAAADQSLVSVVRGAGAAVIGVASAGPAAAVLVPSRDSYLSKTVTAESHAVLTSSGTLSRFTFSTHAIS